MLNRNLLILTCCQAISVSGAVLVVTLGGIVGSQLAPTPALATLPLSLMVAGTALTTVPAAMTMQRLGRRLGFAMAALLGAVATVVAAIALERASFVMFCIATMLIGGMLAFSQQYRFAAAESVPTRLVARAVALVLFGAIGGAFLGPALVTGGIPGISDTPYVGAVLGLGLCYVVAAVLLLGLREPETSESVLADEQPRPIITVVRQPLFIVAVMGGVVGYGIMTFIMTAAPLSMHVHDGFSIEATAGVIRSHVIAMYAPSLVSAYLIERFGVRRMMALGVVVFVGTMTFALGGREILHYTWAMVLLGVGWSFLYIGGTTLLVTTYRAAERFKAQAVNDFSVFGSSALGSLSAGAVLHYFGWTQVIVMSMPLLLIMMAALYLARSAPAIGYTPERN
ncbi:MAG: MFS transporter [Gammaproteobacteria bacterium]|nr:MFS transporter [Gammaproteobacteria bacterium]